MKKTKSRKIVNKSNIISFDPYKNQAILFSKNALSLKDPSKLDKKSGLITSYIKNKFIVSTILDMGTELEIDELDGLIYERAVLELGLNKATEYIIRYFPIDLEEGIYSVFIISADDLDQISSKVIEKTTYIDYQIPTSLLFQGLYKFNILPSTSTDCFIYFQEDDAFLAIYKNGQFLQVKSIERFNLNYINNKLAEAQGEKMSNSDFSKFLREKGIDPNNSDLIEILEDIFSYISDILNNLAEKSGLKIDQIYISSSIGDIPGFAEFTKDRTLIQTADFDFNYNLEAQAIDPSRLNILMYYSILAKENNLFDYDLNFSTAIRPPSFFKRDGGVFLTLVTLALIGSCSYPVYNYGMGFYYDYETKLVQEEIDKKQNLINTLEAELRREKARLTSIVSKVQKEKEEVKTKEKVLSQSDKKKNDYAMKGLVMYDLSNFIRQVNVKLTALDIKQRTCYLYLESKDDKPITELIKNIDNSKGYQVNARKIAINKEGIFTSKITVRIR